MENLEQIKNQDRTVLQISQPDSFQKPVGFVVFITNNV